MEAKKNTRLVLLAALLYYGFDTSIMSDERYDALYWSVASGEIEDRFKRFFTDNETTSLSIYVDELLTIGSIVRVASFYLKTKQVKLWIGTEFITIDKLG
jgi:hypothetical protein